MNAVEAINARRAFESFCASSRRRREAAKLSFGEQVRRLRRPDLVPMVAAMKLGLKLTDWDISAEYVRDLKDPSGAPVHGLCWPFHDGQKAHIQVRDPETPIAPNDPPVPNVLTHELLHCRMPPSDNSPAAIVLEEQAVWALTELLTKHGFGHEQARTMIARAMSAHAKAHAPVRRMGGSMTLEELMKVAEALGLDKSATVEDVMAKIAGGESKTPDAPEAPASMAPEIEGEKPPAMGEAPIVDDKEKPPPLAQAAPPVAPKSAQPAPAPRAQAVPVTRGEVDGLRVELLLATEGKHLSTTQRAFAAKLGPDDVRAYLATHAPDEREGAKLPKGPTIPEGKDSASRAPRLAPDARADMNARMGLGRPMKPIERDGNAVVFRAMTADQARGMRAGKEQSR